MTKQIESYMRILKHRLWRMGLFDPDTFEEIESHLHESVEAGIHQGLSMEEAEQRALERFGSIKLVSLAFEKERNHMLQNLLLTLAVAVGLFSAYIDSLPNWDDTGILVGGLLLISGLLTLFGYRRPWLIAVAVGIWIPAYEIFKTHDFLMLIILLIPLIGAYGGWLVRLGIQKTFHPA